jgi:LPXTG-motif cell wall-anchored protein
MVSRSIGLALGLAMLAAIPRDAQAYVREVTKSGVPVAWHYPCVTMQIYLGSAPPVLTADALFAASVQAAAVWSYPALACTDIRLTMVAEPQASANVGHDSLNVIVFRQDSWCRQPTPVDDAGTPQPDCFPASALAVTSVFKNAKTGEILDADIEFNAVDYSWGDLVGQPDLSTSTTADFQNALTHELGHVLGLDHNCFAKSDEQARLNDNTGAPEIDCYGNPTLPDSVINATMYPSVVLSDTQRRTLSSDDELGVCDVYPHVHDVCPALPSDSGCSVLAPGTRHRPQTGPQTALLFTTMGLLLAALSFLRMRQRI